MKQGVRYSSVIPALLILLSMAWHGHSQSIWINEFHYDNAGGDVGEFLEIAVPSSFDQLDSLTLSLYNGGSGDTYGSHGLDTFSLGNSTGGYDFYFKNISGIQNGAPDGFSLDQSGSVLQFISYEGSFEALGGPALGMTSVDIGFSESASTPIGGSLGLTGTGVDYSAFSWTSFTDDTPGALNTGQTLTAVPEPEEWTLIMGGALILFALLRNRQRMASA